MEIADKRHSFLKVLAVLGQFAALLPFVILFDALCLKKLVFWHFLVIYAVFAVFRVSGWLVGYGVSSLQKKRLPKRVLPLTNFLGRIGIVVPTAAFIALGVWLRPDISVYFFILPAAIIIYFGGNLSVGRNYSGIFTRAWFGIALISSIIVVFAMAFSEESEVISAARYLLCAGFAAVTLLTAVLANQTNIDVQTNQRDGGKAVLPEGLRRYNAFIVLGVVGVTMGLFVLAKPVAALLRSFFVALVNGVLYLFDVLARWIDGMLKSSDPIDVTETPVVEVTDGSGPGSIFVVLFIIAAVVLIIVFRKTILNAIRSFFGQLFRSRNKTFDRPFADEITSSHAKQFSARAKKKAERELERQYSRETSPERKYRLGYALFLVKLSRTAYPPVPSDTTDIHREKGEKAFGEDLLEFSKTYNKVRYADLPPTAEELAAEDELLKRLKVSD